MILEWFLIRALIVVAFLAGVVVGHRWTIQAFRRAKSDRIAEDVIRRAAEQYKQQQRKDK